MESGWYTAWSVSTDGENYYLDSCMTPEKASGGTAVVYFSKSKMTAYINPHVLANDIDDCLPYPEERRICVKVIEDDLMPNPASFYNTESADRRAVELEHA